MQAIVCTRRPRSQQAVMPWMCHLLAAHGVDIDAISYETDRARFIGRGRTLVPPAALDASVEQLSGSQGSVLDPIVAIRCRISLEPGQTATIDLVTGMASDRDACVHLIDKYRDRHLADRVFDLAWTHSQVLLRQLNATDRRRPAVRAHGGLGDLRQPVPARRQHTVAEQPPQPVRAVGPGHLRRPADRAAADRRPGQPGTGAANGPGPRLLAAERPGGRPGDLERRARPATASSCRT